MGKVSTDVAHSIGQCSLGLKGRGRGGSFYISYSGRWEGMGRGDSSILTGVGGGVATLVHKMLISNI